MEKERGITLIALVVTIVVLLILAGVSISMLTGENGIIQNTKEAKEKSAISEEIEMVRLAIMTVKINDKDRSINENTLQNAMDSTIGKDKSEVVEDGDGFYVYYKDSDRYYIIDGEEKVIHKEIEQIDQYPGDFTKDKNGNTLAGTEGNPYEIWCIEDLCALSNRVGQNDNYSNGKNFKLMVDLDFKSRFSYVNGKIENQGEIPNCTSIEELKTWLNENGFIPIGDNELYGAFLGNFDGGNHKIKNIYINTDKPAGLFGVVSQGTNVVIKDFSLTGNINVNTDVNVGGIIGGIAHGGGSEEFVTKIQNIQNYANVNGIRRVGGIVGFKDNTGKQLIIENCANYGEITGSGNGIGGIGGLLYAPYIKNCYNSGNINGNMRVGGLIGYLDAEPNKIFNSYNTGNITGTTYCGGLIGDLYWRETYLINCYNVGDVTGEVKGGIIGYANISDELLNMSNVYFVSNTTSNVVGNGISLEASKYTKCTEEELKSKEVVNTFNNYIENNSSEAIDTSDWRKWKYTKNKYPSFE